MDCCRFALVFQGHKKNFGYSYRPYFSQNLCKSTEDLENELLVALSLRPESFRNKDMLIERAYNILEKKVAYSISLSCEYCLY